MTLQEQVISILEEHGPSNGSTVCYRAQKGGALNGDPAIHSTLHDLAKEGRIRKWPASRGKLTFFGPLGSTLPEDCDRSRVPRPRWRQ